MADHQKNDKSANIQIILKTEETLKEYYNKVNGEKINIFYILKLPYDFTIRCPICCGKDCCRFIGYYPRPVVDENGTYYKAFPIARFKCRRNGKDIKVPHITFSLLAYQLAPYTKYSIPYIIKILKLRHIEGESINKIQAYLSKIKVSDDKELSVHSIESFKKLIEISIKKILVSGYYPTLERKLQVNSAKVEIKIFIEFAESFYSHKIAPQIRGPCVLSYDYYISGNGYYSNHYFLYGTPSQFRKL